MWWISYSLPTCETKAPVTPLSRVASVTLVGEPPYQLDTHPFSFLFNIDTFVFIKNCLVSKDIKTKIMQQRSLSAKQSLLESPIFFFNNDIGTRCI